MSEICRKDSLTRNMSRMVKMFPKEYAFYPKAWCLPAEYVLYTSYKNIVIICLCFFVLIVIVIF
jgi:hypothetical protein